MRKLQQLVRQLVGAGLLDAAELLLTDLEYLTLKFEVGLANEVAEEYEALRMAKRARGQGASAFLDAAREFEAFIAQSRGVFARQPSLLFQTAANMQEDGSMSRAAALVLSLQRPHPPWLRWINAPCDNDIGAVWTLQAHDDSVAVLAVSEDGKWLATASTARVCRIWELASGLLKHTLPIPQADVQCLAWSPDSDYVAVGDENGGVKMWVHNRYHVPASSESHVAVFGITAHTGAVHALSFVKMALSASGSNVPDQPVYYSNVAQPGGKNDDAEKLVLLTAGSDGMVKVWSTATSGVIHVLKEHVGTVHGLVVRGSPAPSPGTRCMAHVISKRLAQRRALIGHRKSPHKPQLSPVQLPVGNGRVPHALTEGGEEGKRVMSCGQDCCIREWQLDSGECMRTLRGHSGPVLRVDVEEELDLMVSASEDKCCFMWRLSDGKRDVQTHVKRRTNACKETY